MKKKMFIAITICIIVFPILLELFFMYVDFQREQARKMHPTSQVGTVWQSSDGRVSFLVVPDSDGTLIPVTIENESGPIKLGMSIWTVTPEVLFKMPSESSAEETMFYPIANGFGECKDYNEYIITISAIYSDSNIFEPGEKIVFHRISIPEPEETETVESEVGSPRIRPIKP